MKAIVTVGGLTGVSRIAGFVRDILTAAILGAGPIADAFFVALKLPNFFRRITAEGAFSVSFIPMFSDKIEREGKESALIFAGQALTWMFAGLCLFSVLAILFMPFVIDTIAPGFVSGELRYGLAIELSRITFPYLLCMSVVALFGGILNTVGRYAAFAAAPIWFNMCLITTLLLAHFFPTPGHAMAWGIFVAGVVQVIWMWWFIGGQRLKFNFQKPVLSADIKKLFCLMGPGAIGAGVMHINLFVDLVLASFLTSGSISYLYYADRLNQLPLGIVGIAIGTALLPMMARSMATGQHDETQKLFNQSILMALVLALPAAIALMVLPAVLIEVLFQRGAFVAHDTIMTSQVLIAYALGLPAYIMIKIYSSVFWARHDTLTPVKYSVLATAFNIGLSVYLIWGMGYGVQAIAYATSLAGWGQVVLLHVHLRRIDVVRWLPDTRVDFVKLLCICSFIGAVLWGLNSVYVLSSVFTLFILVLGTVLVYGVALHLTGVVTRQQWILAFRKGS